MTDHDERVARRYAELGREEPGAALDAAILAASRRSVARSSWSRRWAGPVSIAAVLVLAVRGALPVPRDQTGLEPPEARAPRPPAPPAGGAGAGPLEGESAREAGPARQG